MTTYKVSLLIPCTSNGRLQWKTIKDTYLYNFFLKSFLITYNKEFQYTFYIGYDNNDRIFSKSTEQNEVINMLSNFLNIKCNFICFNNIQRGHLTKMWNILFQKAYEDGNEYFYQCGDDIIFKTTNWIKDSIEILKKNNDIGLSGPKNNNPRILTQAMVSRKHMEIFGFFFPEEIINWGCDDWYNIVYSPKYLFPLNKHYCKNNGGVPRYIINNNKNFKKNQKQNVFIIHKQARDLAQKYKPLIEKYMNMT